MREIENIFEEEEQKQDLIINGKTLRKDHEGADPLDCCMVFIFLILNLRH